VNKVQQWLQVPYLETQVKSCVTVLNKVIVQQNEIFVPSPFLSEEIYSTLPTMYTQSYRYETNPDDPVTAQPISSNESTKQYLNLIHN
jgi:hypothetical protein